MTQLSNTIRIGMERKMAVHHRKLECVKLGDSAVDCKRMGSTFQTFTPAFSKISGDWLQETKNNDVSTGMIKRKRAWGSKHNMKFGDVGIGHGDVSNAMNIFHGVLATGFEVESRVNMACIANARHLTRKNEGKITFMPIFGDANNLEDGYGGADVLYAWVQGCPRAVVHKIMMTFVNDNDALYILTNALNYQNIWPDHIRLIQLKHFHMSGKNTGSRTIYLYGKKVYCGRRNAKSTGIQKPVYREPSRCLRWAFEQLAELRSIRKRSLEEYDTKLAGIWEVLEEERDVQIKKQLGVRKRYTGDYKKMF